MRLRQAARRRHCAIYLTLSDEWLSPQAAVLSPAATIEIASAIVAKTDPYERAVAAGGAAVEFSIGAAVTAG